MFDAVICAFWETTSPSDLFLPIPFIRWLLHSVGLYINGAMPTPGAILVTTEPPDGAFNLACLAIIATPYSVVHATQLFLELLGERKVSVILFLS
jgi:hypothetical protein